MDDDDPADELRRLNARGRKKTVRRFLQSSASAVPFLVVWLGLWPFVGWVIAIAMAALVGVGVAIALEKMLPPVDPE